MMLVVVESSSAAATQRVRYAPIDEDGTLRDGLSVTPGGMAECTSGSFWVVGAFRCFEANRIHDVCYADDRDPEESSVLCVSSPWARVAVRLQLVDEPDGSYGAEPGGIPWAMELASGRRCIGAGGASTSVAGRRMNYVCGRYGTPGVRYLFGSPDRTRSVWRIRQATTPLGRGMRKVAIKVAWR